MSTYCVTFRIANETVDGNNKDHSDTIFNPNHPMSFDGKIKHLKRWFNQHPALSELSEDVRTITSKLKELQPHRNNLIHGVVEEWRSDDKTAVFRTLTFMGNDKFKISTHEYSLEAVMTVGGLASSANSYLSLISRAVFTRDALAQLRKR